MREIGVLLDRVNQYIDANKPWELAKVEGEQERLHAVCSTSLNFFWYLTVLLRPVLPETARKVQALLRLSGCADAVGSSMPRCRRVTRSAPYEHLMTRADAEAARCAARSRRGCGEARRARRRAARGCTGRRRSHGRRLREARSAHREDRRCRSRGRRGQAAEAHARHRRGTAHRVRRHSLGVHARAAARTHDAGACESQAAQDALRRFRRHGAAPAGTLAGRTSSCWRRTPARRRG